VVLGRAGWLFRTGKRLRYQGLWLEDRRTVNTDFGGFHKLATVSGLETVLVFLGRFQELVLGESSQQIHNRTRIVT
jgi:hypothetical protein